MWRCAGRYIVHNGWAAIASPSVTPSASQVTLDLINAFTNQSITGSARCSVLYLEMPLHSQCHMRIALEVVRARLEVHRHVVRYGQEPHPGEIGKSFHRILWVAGIVRALIRSVLKIETATCRQNQANPTTFSAIVVEPGREKPDNSTVSARADDGAEPETRGFRSVGVSLSDFQIPLMRQPPPNRYRRFVWEGGPHRGPVQQRSHIEAGQPCSDYAIS